MENVDTSVEGPERETFLLRRLVLRLKDKLLQHIKLIETGKHDGEDVDELEWSIKQIARRILSSKMP